MPLEDALALRAVDNGALLGEELARIGYAGRAPVGSPRVDSFVELHIEQGPVLDREGIAIGVVEGVQGICWTELIFTGRSNHAGTTPMALRQDAGMAAARVAAFAHELSQRYGGRQLATVGALTLQPHLVNVSAQSALMTVDLRNTDGALLQRAQAELLACAHGIAAEHGVQLSHRLLADFAPVAFDAALVDSVERAAHAQGLATLRMPSGAGHDAQMLARVCPTAMVFVPSRDGLSHNVREFTAPEQLVQGANVLLQVLVERADR
ncbi:MAG: hydantoinase/carbamoylase family amidase, partial [Comamonas sp.]